MKNEHEANCKVFTTGVDDSCDCSARDIDINRIAAANADVAVDQENAPEYIDTGDICHLSAFDSYSQNTFDTVIEQGGTMEQGRDACQLYESIWRVLKGKN